VQLHRPTRLNSSTFVDCWTGKSAALAFENPAGIDAGLTIGVPKIGSVAHQEDVWIQHSFEETVACQGKQHHAV
jgi:hypothetical protein